MKVQIQCKGRGPHGQTVLETPVPIVVELTKYPGNNLISVGPKNCPYNTGGHGQRCKASHPGQDKVGNGVCCPFSFDYPYARRFLGWSIPSELKLAVAELEESSS